MSAVWLIIAFVAGVLFMHYAGRRLAKFVFNRGDERWTNDVLSSLSIASLRKLGRACDAELEKRRAELGPRDV